MYKHPFRGDWRVYKTFLKRQYLNIKYFNSSACNCTAVHFDVSNCKCLIMSQSTVFHSCRGVFPVFTGLTSTNQREHRGSYMSAHVSVKVYKTNLEKDIKCKALSSILSLFRV